MSVYKDEKGGWRVIYRYTDWTGEKKQSSKRGFSTKREALQWEREQQRKQTADFNMTFGSFVALYEADMKSRFKRTTWIMKENIIRNKLLPYFKNKPMCDITPKDIIQWQNVHINTRNEKGEPLSPVYLKTIHNQLSTIFNHAVKFYHLKENPAQKVGNMGKAKNKEKEFWTKQEYLTFIDAMMDKPVSYYAFQMLYWTGMRVGELLALTPSDIDFDKETVSISKSYQRIGGEDIITSPKTEKSNRVIQLPQFLCEEMREYIQTLYQIKPTDRLFVFTTSYLHSEMTRGCKATGVKRIAIHSLRHSAVSLLIELGFSATAIAARVGHESIHITYHYAHMFPSKQIEMADQLNLEGGSMTCR